MEYGINLKKMRVKAGYTQESLAFDMGVSTSVVNRLESGKQKFKVELIALIAKAMNKSPENILSELNGITINSSIQENNENGVKIDNTESIRDLYEKLLTEKERYISFLEKEIKRIQENQV